MSFTQKSYLSPSKSWKSNDNLAKSILLKSSQLNPSKFETNNSKTKFKDCFYHSKPIRYLCISQNCQNKYFTLCDHPQCKELHSHPNLHVIDVQQFDQFKIQHLKSINMLKNRIRKYEKNVIENVVHKLTKDFQLVQRAIDTFYIHKAARKINQGKLDELTAKQLNQFVTKATLANEKSTPSVEVNMESSGFYGAESFQSTFIDSKNQIITVIQSLQESISKLTRTEEYKILTLQQSILTQTPYNDTLSPSKGPIKKSSFTSKIIQFQQEYQTILKMLKQNRFTNFKQFKLLYRASQNQFSAQRYHATVDGKSPLLMLFFPETGMKFGAFINCKPSQSNDWVSDPTGLSFIFSLDHNESYRLMSSANHRTKAFFGGNKGPQIGSGCDIYISDRCDQNSQSGSNFGGSYQLPFGLDYGSKKARSFLAGKENFSMTEYEVFQLV